MTTQTARNWTRFIPAVLGLATLAGEEPAVRRCHGQTVYAQPAAQPVYVAAPSSTVVVQPPAQTVVMAPQPAPRIIFAAPAAQPATFLLAPMVPAPAPMMAAPAALAAAPPGPSPAPATVLSLSAPGLVDRLLGTVGEHFARKKEPRLQTVTAGQAPLSFVPVGQPAPAGYAPAPAAAPLGYAPAGYAPTGYVPSGYAPVVSGPTARRGQRHPEAGRPTPTPQEAGRRRRTP